MAAPTGAVETASDFGKTPAGIVQRWLAEIKAYDTSFRTYHEQCDRIIKRYRDEQDSETKRMRFNVLWSNIQTLGPAVYAKRPVPEVVRRNKDRDPVSLCAAEVLKRTLTTEIDLYDFDGQMKAARDDYLLCGRGQLWIRYVPQFGPETRDRSPVTVASNDDGSPRYLAEDGSEVDHGAVQFDETGQPYSEGEPYKPVVHEYVTCDHIQWRNFGHTPAPTWSKVTAVWKRELMTREKLVERFGDIGSKIGLTVSVAGIADESKNAFGDVFKRGEVYEIWDSSTRRVIWLSPGYTDAPLDEQDDPLGLEGFFPCPRPLYGTITTDSLIPVPDYIEYQSQAVELDNLTARLGLLTKALRVVGVYDGSVGDKLKLILDGDDNDMVPVDNWAMFAEKGGLNGTVSFLPIKEIADTAIQLFNARAQIKRDLDEITGLSDIIRGQSTAAPRTATEQRIKGQFATLRLQDRQNEVNRFVRDVMRIKSEIIAEHFAPQTLLTASNWLNTANARALDKAATAPAQIDPSTGQPAATQLPAMGAAQVFEQAVQLLKDDNLRSFKIDIETDSTIYQDQQAEKQSRIEFLGAATQFLTQAVPAGQQYPELRPVLAEMLMFGVRAFATGSSLEDVFDQAMEDMESAPPSPAQNAAMAQQQADAQKTQAQQAIEQAKLAHQQQSDAADHDLDVAKFQADVQDRQNQHEREMAKLALDRERLNHEISKHALDRQDQIDQRRLDGKMTPTFEEDMQKMQDAMAALAASIAQLAQAQTAAMQHQDQQMATMLAALTAPKKLVRDAQGRPAGVEVDMSRMN